MKNEEKFNVVHVKLCAGGACEEVFDVKCLMKGYIEISLLQQRSHLPVSKDCRGIEHVDRIQRDSAGEWQTIEFVHGKFTKNHRPVRKTTGCRLLSASFQRIRQKPMKPMYANMDSPSRRKTVNAAF